MNQNESQLKPDICRICLSSSNLPMHQLRNCPALKESSERNDLLSLVFKAISVSICPDANECKICHSCDNQLLATLQFLEMCRKSEKTFDEHLVEPEISIKLEKNEDEPVDSISIKDNTPEKTNVCNQCSKTFFSTRQLNLHIRKSHKTQTDLLSCDFCQRKFTRKTQLSKHLQKHITVEVNCFCGKKFDSESLLQRHCRRTHAPKKYKCSECDKSFRVKSSLISHENKHLGIKPLLCTSCPLTFASYTGLSSHQRRHHSTEPWVATKKPSFLCDTCGASFSRKHHLQRHVYHIHTKNVQRSFTCSQCNKAFTSNERLKNHTLIHKPHSMACPDCDRTFLTRYRLNMHIDRIHLQLRPFPCTTCGKSFKVKSHLEKHLRTHTGEKPHQCPFCVYKCAEKSNLQKHLRVHYRKN